MEHNCLARESNHRKSWEGGKVPILLVHVGMSHAFLMMRVERAVALELALMDQVLLVLYDG
jgi:hypothetical protein